MGEGAELEFTEVLLSLKRKDLLTLRAVCKGCSLLRGEWGRDSFPSYRGVGGCEGVVVGCLW